MRSLGERMIELRYVPIDRRVYPLPRRRKERFPLERLTLLALLDDETLYSPSAVAAVGYIKGSIEYIRARRAFSYFASANGLQVGCDNADDQGEAKAWYGAAWKRAAGGRMHRVADLMEQLYRRLRDNPDLRFYLNHETLLTEKDLTGLEKVKHLARPQSGDAQIALRAPIPPHDARQPQCRYGCKLLIALVALAALTLLAWSASIQGQ